MVLSKGFQSFVFMFRSVMSIGPPVGAAEQTLFSVLDSGFSEHE